MSTIEDKRGADKISMPLLLNELGQYVEEKILSRANEGRGSTVIANPLAAKSLIACALAERLRKIVIASPKEEEALLIKEDIDTLIKTLGMKMKAFLLPERPRSFGDRIYTDASSSIERSRAIHATGKDSFIVIGSYASLSQKIMPSLVLRERTLSIRPGDFLDMERLKTTLLENGYTLEVNCENPGAFSVRGGIIDIFSTVHVLPARIDFEGDRIESLRKFDPVTQLTIQDPHMDILEVPPAREVILSKENRERALSSLRDLTESIGIGKKKRKILFDAVANGTFFPGIECFLPAFYEDIESFFDLLARDTQIVGINSFQAAKILSGAEARLFEDYERDIKEEKIVFHPKRLNLTAHEFEKELNRSRISLDDFFVEDARCEKIETGSVEIHIQDPLKEKGYLKQLIGIVESNHRNGYTTFIFPQEPGSERLSKGLSDRGKTVLDMTVEGASAGQQKPDVILSKGSMSGSFSLPSLKLSFIDETILFRKKRRYAEADTPTKQLTGLKDLAQGDYVVHSEHGVARYSGLTHLKAGGTEGDFLLLQFAEGDKLYLPIYKMDLVHKYIGADSRKPKLSSLGSKLWERAKLKAIKAIREMAMELVRLYAQRKIIKGFSLPKPDENYYSFEALFPYEETADQKKSVEDVFRDMEDEKPMDRLVCGDVGYGKTEVAIRASYRAAMAGYQVAMLVPTTVLAQQHLETFKKRFEDYPVEIDFLSRFKSKKEQKKTVRSVKEGKTDIVIGTHRLLSEDIEFKNLGLLIIDEEHRFGVRHKEKIKKYKNRIDVLALSATPIPRSMEMSLIGLRDLSVINTAPPDRKAVKTYIARFDDDMIKEAVTNEMARGGQVFFVHNRIETIDSVHAHLRKILPDVTISVAHGRMREDRLEKVMLEFLNKKSDMLLSTAIIESGLDIPNANTILINRADTLGLAQLYQLRGRVGRSRELAHAYLLLPEEEFLSEDAAKRLKVLQNFTELGSGIKIALHDLEIRGAGNLFGSAQSGHIAAIGFEMYTKILETTIRKLKGEDTAQEFEPDLKVNVEAFIQNDYISDVGERLSYYKRLAQISKESELDDIAFEMKDRFGPLPGKVEMLLKISSLKAVARRLKIKELLIDGRNVTFKLDETSRINPNSIVGNLKSESMSYQGGGRIRLNLRGESPFERLESAKKMLLKLL